MAELPVSFKSRLECFQTWITLVYVTHMHESRHAYEVVMSHVWIRPVTYVNASHHTYRWIMSHVRRSYVSSEWAMSNTQRSHATHVNTSKPSTLHVSGGRRWKTDLWTRCNNQKRPWNLKETRDRLRISKEIFKRDLQYSVHVTLQCSKLDKTYLAIAPALCSCLQKSEGGKRLFKCSVEELSW